mgnify:FL=1
MIGHVQVPEAFPEIQDCPLVFRRENQLLCPTWTIPGIGGEKTTCRCTDDCPYHQCDKKPTHEPFLLDQFEAHDPEGRESWSFRILKVSQVGFVKGAYCQSGSKGQAQNGRKAGYLYRKWEIKAIRICLPAKTASRCYLPSNAIFQSRCPGPGRFDSSDSHGRRWHCPLPVRPSRERDQMNSPL